ncbi:MAG: AAA family ATPase [Saccharospirillum sp.]|nr:AAA family ATPase [Saccharospirillum sp.]
MPDIASVTQQLLDQSRTIIAGKDEVVRLAWVAILCDGHILLEDLPGVGKTSLAQSLARLLSLDFQRVQFTSDLLPADVLGAQMFNRELSQFEFHAGPVFTQLLLADELNRATPKAQSALLEAMEERQVSIDGISRPLPDPFYVIATQNPRSQSGTYPLPESQLDRFFVRLSLGYPDTESEKGLLRGTLGRTLMSELQPVLSPESLVRCKAEVHQVKVSEAVLDYVMRLVHRTRDADLFRLGLSPRGALALMMASRAMALTQGRHYVMPDDVQAVFSSVTEHRVQGQRQLDPKVLVQQVLDDVDVLAA